MRKLSNISHPSSIITYHPNDHKFRRIFLMEYLGTVLFGIGLHCAKNDLDVQITIFCAMLFSARHSGAHYHIAVTLILMFRPHHPISKLRGVIQILVGIAGFCTGAIISHYYVGVINPPDLQNGDWIYSDLFGEIIATTSFQFMNVLLFEKDTAIFTVPLYNTILLDFAIYYSRKLSPHSGGCMNPTIALGFNLANYIVNGTYSKYLWVFIVGPMIGSLIVFVIYYGVIQRSDHLCAKFRSFGY